MEKTKEQFFEEELKKSEEKYHLLYKSLPLPYQSLDKNGCFLDVNPMWLSTLGYKREEIIGKYYKDFLHDDKKPIFEKNFPILKKVGIVCDVPFKLRHKNGHFIEVLLNGNCGYYPDGSFKQTYCVFQDVTTRNQYEKEIKRFSRIFENSLNEIFLFDAATLKFTEANKAAQNNLGYTMEELKELSPIDIKPKYTKETFSKLVAPLFKGEKEKIVFETIHQRKDKSIYNVEVHLQLQEYEGVSSFAAMILDITERKKVEKALQERELTLQLLFDNMSNGFAHHKIIVDKNNKAINYEFIKINKAFEKHTGLIAKQIIGKQVTEVIPGIENDSTDWIAMYGKVALQGKEIQFESFTKPLNKWYRISAYCPRHGEFVTIFEDISKLKKTDQEKYKAMIHAEEKERQRLAHDLHDGLGQTIAAANMHINSLDDLVKDQLDSDTYSIFKTSKKLINEATKETRFISHNIMPPSLKQFGLERSISDFINNYQKIKLGTKFKISSNIYNIRFSEDVELEYYRCVQEIISNAIKHSKAKTIKVELNYIDKRLKLTVIDNGIGFDSNKITKKKESGIGLVNLSYRIKALGGELFIDSKPSEGTTINLIITNCEKLP